jgi:hypothetical protein
MSETDLVIRRLASQAGKNPDKRRMEFGTLMPILTLLALALSILVILVWFGSGLDLDRILRSAAFLYKAGSMILLAAGAFVVVRHLAMPGTSALSALALLPGLVVLTLGAGLDPSDYPLFGRTAVSVPSCMIAIVTASLPGLGILMFAVRRGLVTRPLLTGAATGILAGALGGAAYAIACKNDGAAFVLVWYGLAILVVGGIGAGIGWKWLRW